MKNLLVSLLFFNYGLALCQIQNETVQDADTLYVYFKHRKNEKVRDFKLIIPPKIMEKRYSFNFDKPLHFYDFLQRTHMKQEGEQIEMPILVKDKKFLKIKKNKVFTFCYFKKKSLKEIEDFYWKNKNKIIFLIDKKESKKGKIYLKKVSMTSGYFTEQ